MEKSSLFGMYRAVVVDNQDKEKFGKILVWVPDIMPLVDRTSKGIWARPANNPIGGRNTEDNSDNHYAGSSYIPRKGSWVFIFFEGGNINRPYYFGAADLENTKVLPENQVGTNPQDKWTIIKSSAGRTIIVSDDFSDERVEITGKKRLLTNPPSGDIASVYKIDNNMTTILLDERTGKEKILIRTYKGDFINIDVENQNLEISFANNIDIKCNNNMKITINGDLDIKSLAGDMRIEASSGDINIKSATDFNQQSGASSNSRSQLNSNTSSGASLNHKSGATINNDAVTINDQSGAAKSADGASSALVAVPTGERS